MYNKLEFYEIVSDIIKNDKFKKLKDENHHGISRLDHSLNVAKFTYMIAKKLHMKHYKKITRGALLHDLFLNEELEGKIKFVTHSAMAAKNAKKEFNVSDLEYSMIKTHMFPVSIYMPENKESWLLITTDKIVGAYEVLKYKMPLYTKTYYLLFLNIVFK